MAGDATSLWPPAGFSFDRVSSCLSPVSEAEGLQMVPVDGWLVVFRKAFDLYKLGQPYRDGSERASERQFTDSKFNSRVSAVLNTYIVFRSRAQVSCK